MKLIIILLLLLLPYKPKPQYLVIIGDITCKACVLDAENYLKTRIKKDKLVLCFRDRKNIISNQLVLGYYKNELPKANFLFLKDSTLFLVKERYPYLLKIDGKDTLKMPYDSLFIGEYLNTSYLLRHF